MTRRKKSKTNSGDIRSFFSKSNLSEKAGASREDAGEEGVPVEGVAGRGSQENPDVTVLEEGGATGGDAGVEEKSDKQEDTMAEEQYTPCLKHELKTEEPHEHTNSKPHEHTISWKYKEDSYIWPCRKDGTILQSLQRSDAFQKIEKANLTKELVILCTQRESISSHFPCQNVEPDTTQIIEYIKAKNVQTITKSINKPKMDPDQIVIFSIRTTGRKNIRNSVVKIFELKHLVDQVKVYGYKGQKVSEALKQDGRLSDTLFQSNYVLENTLDGKLIEMSSLVDVLHDKCFMVKRSSKKTEKLTPLSGENHDASNEQTSSEIASSKIPPPPTASTSIQHPPNTSNQPNTEVMALLRSQFPLLFKHMKGRKKSTTGIPQAFCKEYGKNSSYCHEARAMRMFLKRGDSVCQVRVDGQPVGSGFLLCDKYILTNAHVVLDRSINRLMENISVIFSYEILTDNQLLSVEVVHCYFLEQEPQEDRFKEDWALLEVCDTENTQPINREPLLKHVGLVREEGQICLIGHPDGKVKMIDPCVTVPSKERETKYRNLPVDLFFRDIQTYESCFYEGSSGSPVFDDKFKVVSMHSGGFHLGNDETVERIVEYSHPLLTIIQQIIIQIVEKKKMDVLWAMIACGIPPDVMDALKERVERNELKALVLTEIEMNLLTESIHENKRQIVKEFFGYILTVPMDLS